jgi:DUF4097 and DUF4098 domain-containing protein YvlB
MITAALFAALLQVTPQQPPPPRTPAPRPAPAPAQQARSATRTDTTFAVPANGRLLLDALNGVVTVRAWDRAEVRVQAAHPSNTRIVTRLRGRDLRLESEQARGPHGRVEYHVTVPRAFGIQVEGVNLPVTVHDVGGVVRVSNVEGAVTVSGTSGALELESVGGVITVDNARGAIEVSTVNQGIRLNGVQGRIRADAVNGSIIMRGVDADRVEASTVNGEISFTGNIHDRGRYYFGAHNGRITLALPEQANATLRIESKTGRIDAGFPVPVTSIRDGHFAATFGTGSASIEVESFNGNVRLVRPGR